MATVGFLGGPLGRLALNIALLQHSCGIRVPTSHPQSSLKEPYKTMKYQCLSAPAASAFLRSAFLRHPRSYVASSVELENNKKPMTYQCPNVPAASAFLRSAFRRNPCSYVASAVELESIIKTYEVSMPQRSCSINVPASHPSA